MTTKKEPKETSVNTYKSSLKSLGESIDINNITNIKQVMDIFEERKYSENTQKNHLNALIWYYDHNKINESLMKDMNNNMKNLADKIRDRGLDNIPNEKEKGKYVTWQTIKNIYNEIEKLYLSDKNNKKIHTIYIILSYYVLMPVRRVQDYSELYYVNDLDSFQKDKVVKYNSNFEDTCEISNNKPNEVDINDNVQLPDEDIKIVLDTDNEDGNEKDGDGDVDENEDEQKDNTLQIKNYYVMKDNGYFVFELYKTTEKYGIQYFEINPKLNTLLKEYIAKYNIQNGDKILKLTRSNFIQKIRYLFTTVINKPIGVSSMRHIFISHMKDSKKINCKRHQIQLANLMGHSVSTQSDYYRIVENLQDTVINIEDIKKLLTCMGPPRKYTPEEAKLKILENKRRSRAKKKKENLDKISGVVESKNVETVTSKPAKVIKTPKSKIIEKLPTNTTKSTNTTK